MEANVTDMTGHAIGAPPPTDTGVLHAYDGMFSATSSSDHVIMTAIGAGKLDAAIDVCLHEDRMDDALMIAVAGGYDSSRLHTAAFSFALLYLCQWVSSFF